MKFLEHVKEIIIFSALMLLVLMLGRVTEMLWFGNMQELQKSAQYWPAFFMRAFRFDLKYLSVLLIVFFYFPLILFSLFPSSWFSFYVRLILKLLLIFTLYILFVDFGYLFYFQKPIDVLVFGFLQDDTGAILNVIFNNKQLILLFILFIVFSFIAVRLFSVLSYTGQGSTAKHRSKKLQFISWLVSLLALIVLARGSIDTFPLQRKHASVSDNRFLNSLVMNSPFNLYYAFVDQKVNNRGVFNQDILKLNGVVSIEELMQKAGYSEKQPLIRTTAKDELLEQIKPHIIFVQMESWSAQIARDNSDTNNVLGQFAHHAREDHFYTQIFSNKYATNPTIENLLLNSPITPLAQSVASNTRFSLSNVIPFKNKGYKTQFLSGGFSSWRNHDKFWPLQGFDRYVGRSKIESTYQVDASDNPWGVYDGYVFKYLEKTIEEADAKGESLFSFVLTTNNHAPVRLPKDFKVPPLQPELYGFDKNDDEARNTLSGYYYESDQLGRFISWVKNSQFKDKVIIVATGDHPMRHFVENTSIRDQYIRYAVATYFYVPKAIDKLKTTSKWLAGSHNDLFPTLYELSLSNASYYNFGQPFIEKQPDSEYGWSARGKFIFNDGIVDIIDKYLYLWADEEKEYLDTQPLSVNEKKSRVIEKEHYRRILKKYLLVQDYKKKKFGYGQDLSSANEGISE